MTSQFGETLGSTFNPNRTEKSIDEEKKREQGIVSHFSNYNSSTQTQEMDIAHMQYLPNQYTQTNIAPGHFKYQNPNKVYSFQFKNERINNSPYCVIRGPEFQELVKDALPELHAPFFHNSTLDFSKTVARKPFVTEKDGANPGRFELSDFFDRSTYLTNVPRHKSILPFQKGPGRDDLIAKGGDGGIDLGGKSSVFYDTDKKFKTMKRLDKSVPVMKNTTDRVQHNSIYKRDAVPDYYDSLKVADAKTKIMEKKKKPFIDMKK